MLPNKYLTVFVTLLLLALTSDVAFSQARRCNRCGRTWVTGQSSFSPSYGTQFPQPVAVSTPSRPGNIVAAYGRNPAAVQHAMRSASYRASRGITGHSSYDTGGGFRYSGVGWSSGGDPRSIRTCYFEMRNGPSAGYACARDSRGRLYSTTIVK